MPTVPKMILAAVLRGLPFVIIIVSSGIYAVKRKSILGGMLAIGCIAIAVPSVFSIFAHLYIRTHTVADYGRIMLPMSICSLTGWYVSSIACALLMFWKRRRSDNNLVEDIATNAANSHQ